MQRLTSYSGSPTRSFVKVLMSGGSDHKGGRSWVELKLAKDTDGYSFTAVDQGWGQSAWFRDDMLKTFAMDREAAVAHLQKIVKVYEAADYTQNEVLTCHPGRRPTEAERNADTMLKVASEAAGAVTVKPTCGCRWYDRDFIKNVGRCLNLYRCSRCGAEDTIDSSG